jgi:hypothetical protein
MRSTSVFLAFILATLACAQLAFAAPCPECPAPGTPAAERDKHALVFVGTVFAARDSILPAVQAGPKPYVRVVVVHVRGIWKGLPAREVVMTLDACAARGIDPEPGEYWVFYADSLEDKIVLPACTRSGPWSKARAEIDAFGKPASYVLPGSKRSPR